MEKLLISGGKKLRGSVRVSGAKNAALPIMASTILGHGTHKLRRVPNLRDVFTMGRLLEHLGAGFSLSDSTALINTEDIKGHEAPYDLVRTMRASVLVLGPLLARHGRARVSLPGGCAIGARPINLHLQGLQKMGALISLDKGYVNARTRRLRGANICFDIPTVTGTENLMMAATLAKGLTRLENAAREPEVIDLANALISVGARIEGAGESIIVIEGVKELNSLDYDIIPDRIEAGTFIAAAGITGGEIVMEGVNSEHIAAVVAKLQETGIVFQESEKGLVVRGPQRLMSSDVKTMPYPGFPTDMQAQFMALMSVAEGTSVISETIFENRFMHVAELRRMGADINIEGSIATVKGVKSLKGAPVMATDLRASASLVVAALAARGETLIDRIYHLDRGYESIESKLRSLGARIERQRG
ncbi:MAG TPA: UDP-N-acetylglucosamine 1-carboxyvinyltransferase [Nitrospirae bacterium]|nr:UDP-N-acetylglucosamine 1-carboxyvinyltransferase [Nitrospirota bacterium]